MQRIRDGLYLLEAGRAVNCYLIEGQGLTLVDTGPASRIDALVAEILAGGFQLDDLQRIVLTHAHPDHAGGAATLLKRKRVKVYAHPEEIPVLEGRSPMPRGRGVSGWLRAATAGWGGKPEPLSPVVAASPREPIRGLAQWQVVHAPGHTPGSLALFDPANGVLLCGDAVSNRGGALSLEGLTADPVLARETLSRLAALDVDVLGCGRGPVVRPRAWKLIEALIRSPRP